MLGTQEALDGAEALVVASETQEIPGNVGFVASSWMQETLEGLVIRADVLSWTQGILEKLVETSGL